MSANVLQWDGGPGHYEVYHVSATDPRTGIGLWIRYTMRSGRVDGFRRRVALWFMAMDRDGARFARKATHPIDALTAQRDPFRLTLAGADLSDRGMAGAFEDVAWELRGSRRCRGRARRSAVAARGIAKTILVLAHPDLAVFGTVRFAGRELVLDSARQDRRTCGAPSTRRAGRGPMPTTCAAQRASRDRAATSTASASTCALRAPAGAEHARGRTLRR